MDEDHWGLQSPFRARETAFDDDHPEPAWKPLYGRPERALEAIGAVVDRFEVLHRTRRPETVKLVGEYIEVFGQGSICRAPADEDLRPTIMKLLGLCRDAVDLRMNNPIMIHGEYCRINEHYRRTYPDHV